VGVPRYPDRKQSKCEYVKDFTTMALAATGIVFGDIGTSPLYTFQGIYTELKVKNPKQEDLIGTFSCIFWALTLVVFVKYIMFVMRIDYHGEGGTFAMLQAINAGAANGKSPPWTGRAKSSVTMLAILGCSLLIGDGAITPAMSVLGALEGLTLMVDCDETTRVVATVVILLLLFAIQFSGSKIIGLVSGPFMVLWFFVIGALGVHSIYLHPNAARHMIHGFSPKCAFDFFVHGEYRGQPAWRSLGGVVLCVTGAEALYADMGHFGAKPIALTWAVLVYPCLVLQYFGQAIHLMEFPEGIENPFYHGVPAHVRWPVLVIATLAAIIASQALISGVFTLLAQAHALDFCPRILVLHTNADVVGQVYIPEVNFVLCVLCLLFVVAFKNTHTLASAYGVAVTSVTLITTLLLGIILRRVWRWNYVPVLLVTVPIFAIDLAFWSANIIKVVEVGWVPLVITGVGYLLMATYHWGRSRKNREPEDIPNRSVSTVLEASATPGSCDRSVSTGSPNPVTNPGPSPKRSSLLALQPRGKGGGPSSTMSETQLVDLLRLGEKSGVRRTNACSVFMTRIDGKVPQSLPSLALTFGCLPRTIILLTIRFEEHMPFVKKEDRGVFEPIDVATGVYRIILTFGYAEPLTAVQHMRDGLAKVARMHVREYPALRPLVVVSSSSLTWGSGSSSDDSPGRSLRRMAALEESKSETGDDHEPVRLKCHIHHQPVQLRHGAQALVACEMAHQAVPVHGAKCSQTDPLLRAASGLHGRSLERPLHLVRRSYLTGAHASEMCH
jgi:KUP system potassium uptake protein